MRGWSGPARFAVAKGTTAPSPERLQGVDRRHRHDRTDDPELEHLAVGGGDRHEIADVFVQNVQRLSAKTDLVGRRRGSCGAAGS